MSKRFSFIDFMQVLDIKKEVMQSFKKCNYPAYPLDVALFINKNKFNKDIMTKCRRMWKERLVEDYHWWQVDELWQMLWEDIYGS